MRFLMKVFFILMAVVVVILGGLMLLPKDKIAKIATDQVKAQTGRDLTLEGEVALSLYPTLGVRTGAVRLSNADWGADRAMFAADAARIGVDTAALLRGDIKIENITLIAPDVFLQKARDGRVNWDFGLGKESAPTQADAPATPPAITVRAVRMQGARLTYSDAQSGAEFATKDVDLSLDWPETGAASVEMRLTPVSTPVAINAQINDLNALISGARSAITADLSAAKSKASFVGVAGLSGEAAGRVTTQSPNLNALMAALLPGAGAPAEALSFTGDVTFDQTQRLSVRNGQITYAGQPMSAVADVFLGGAKPRINAQIHAASLDLDAVMGAGESSAGSAGAGWPTSRIDASGLGAVDGEIALTSDALRVAGLSFATTRMLVRIDNARAVADLRELAGYDGVLAGQFIANARGGLSVRAKMNAKGIEAKTLLSDLAGITRLSGKADAELDVLGSGASVDAIMKSLKGTAAFAFGRGTIAGMDLDKLMRGSTEGGTTIFDSLTASVDIAKGVANNDNLVLALPVVEALGKGRVDLGGQSIDYLFTPQFKRADKPPLAVPVRIQGPWANPKIWPDLKAAVDLNLAEEKARAKEELKRKAEDKIGETLGVTQKEGQSLEDAAKEKIEDELGKGLLKLLGQE